MTINCPQPHPHFRKEIKGTYLAFRAALHVISLFNSKYLVCSGPPIFDCAYLFKTLQVLQFCAFLFKILLVFSGQLQLIGGLIVYQFLCHPSVGHQSFVNIFLIALRCACGFYVILKWVFVTFQVVNLSHIQTWILSKYIDPRYFVCASVPTV